MNDLTILSKRIKEEREKKGWTQEYMANLLEIKVGTLSGYERHYRTPDVEMLAKIADVLNVSMDWLVGRGEGEELPWWERRKVPAEIELEDFIRNQPSLRLFGDPMNEDVKLDIMLAMRTAWEIVNRKKTAKKQP